MCKKEHKGMICWAFLLSILNIGCFILIECPCETQSFVKDNECAPGLALESVRPTFKVRG